MQKLIAIRDDIESLNPTGTTDDDRMAMAVRRYSGIDVQDRNRSGNFPHMGAYIALKGCPKFMSTMSSGRLDAVQTSGQMTANATNLDEGMQITTRSGSLESSKIGPDIEDITSRTTRPRGRKAAKTAKRESQVERLARGSEEHARSLNRIAQGLEEASKRKRSDLLLNISQEDLQLLDSSERERLKNIRAKRLKSLLSQVESDVLAMEDSAKKCEGPSLLDKTDDSFNVDDEDD